MLTGRPGTPRNVGLLKRNDQYGEQPEHGAPAQVIGCLVEGNSIRSTVRLTGAAKNTVSKLLFDLGMACSDYQDGALRNLTCKRVQVDEIWSFVGCKKKNLKPGHSEYWGDAWTFVAIDADTKLVPSWYVGQRDADDARAVLSDLKGRLVHPVQLTTDGHSMYLSAAAGTFGPDLDYAMLVKEYGSSPKDPENTRYSPSPVKSITVKKVSGSPDPAHISTSYVERQNLTIRMGMRRFTRLSAVLGLCGRWRSRRRSRGPGPAARRTTAG